MEGGAARSLGWALAVSLLLGGSAQARPQQKDTSKKLAGPAHHKSPAHKVVKGGKGHHPAHGKARRRGGKRREAPPQMPSRLELTAIDLVTGTAHVDVMGTTRIPASRLFIFTDQEGRRFVPTFAECHPPPGVTLPTASPGADGEEVGEDEEPAVTSAAPELPATTRWRCSLTIPRLYRRAPLIGVTMEWGNLAVAAPADTVQQLWGEARAAAPLSAIAERPHEKAGSPSATSPPTPLLPGRPNLPETESPDDDDPGDEKVKEMNAASDAPPVE